MFCFALKTALALSTFAALPTTGDQPANQPSKASTAENNPATPVPGQQPPDAARHLTRPLPAHREILACCSLPPPTARCEQELARLRLPGGDFEKMQSAGWTIGAGAENHLQIVDRDAIPQAIRETASGELPTVCISDGEIVRSFKSGCTTPLDRWTFGFLAKGIDERPPGSIPEAATVRRLVTIHYGAITGRLMRTEPTKDRVISQLRGPNHGHQIQKKWEIETWSYEEVGSLHDNLHEREMGGVSFSTRSQPSNQFSATRKASGH